MITLIIVLIVLLILSKEKNNKLESENNYLKGKISNTYNYCPECGADLRGTSEEVPVCQHNEVQPEVIERPQVVNTPPTVQSKPRNDNEIKNNLILITGSVLLILAALLFLTTTWNITNNLLKSGVLVTMLLIFVATSHIADKFLNLSNTSKAFHYIALAYLPIVLLSLSFFGLIGDYFSINGEGK